MQEQLKSSARVVYYDAIKTLAIYLVCIYYYNNLKINILLRPGYETYINYFFSGISSMAVPLFFMVNGALLLNKPYNLSSHLKKTGYLYILVYVWSFISLVLFIPIHGDSYSLKEFFKAWFNEFKVGVNNHLWFLQTLISVYLIFPFMKDIYDRQQHKLTQFFCLIVFLFSFGNLFLNNLVNLTEFIQHIAELIGTVTAVSKVVSQLPT
uniref:Acyltransferase, putative n=1 Tax=Cyanothece sp. (strain PCC 7425 / ATCC 29141) TaxID=395961 RepID=B8HUX3_CYAP4